LSWQSRDGEGKKKTNVKELGREKENGTKSREMHGSEGQA